MRRCGWWSRAAAAATLAAALTATTPSPSVAAFDARPLPQEWWFTTWDIQSKVWPITRGEGVTVGVVDTCVQASLPELRGAVLPGVEYGLPDAELRDGHIVNKPPVPVGDGREDTEPSSSHGTAMAQLIAARGRGSGYVGVAPGAKILPVAITSIGQIGDGIRYAVDHGAKVINVSTVGSGQCEPRMQAAIAHAIEHDVVVVASAGNDGNGDNNPEEPASCPGVLSVGAVDFKLRPWVKTQRQPYVTVAAPGVDVSSINVYQELVIADGTSSAAALTTAAVALVRAKYPDMPAREVVQRIVASARDVGEPGMDLQSGYGIARPWHALVDKVPSDSPNPPFDSYAAWQAEQRAAAASKQRMDLLKTVGPIAAAAVLLVIVAAVMLRRRGRARHQTVNGGAFKGSR
jgi:Subtilase family